MVTTTRQAKGACVPRATHCGELRIGDVAIACAVLDDGRRVLGQEALFRAIGRTGKPHATQNVDESSSSKLPDFVAADNLKPYVSQQNQAPPNWSPVAYRTPSGQHAYGYEARVLHDTCRVYRTAARAGALRANQEHIAAACEILQDGFAYAGLAALIDEATGFQSVRGPDVLRAILDMYIGHEFRAYARCFPPDFYREVFRLHGWEWKEGNPAGGPRCLAQITDDLVYARLQVGILDELRRLNPVTAEGKRGRKHHQHFTPNGHPALAEHIRFLTRTMRGYPVRGWGLFMDMLDRAMPRRGRSVQLNFDDAVGMAGGRPV